jgi:hypothetical protein
VTVRWRANGAPLGKGSSVVVHFRHAGPVLISAAAADGHGRAARATLLVRAAHDAP